MKLNQNLLLSIDVYKAGHMRFYKPGTTKVYSYLCARSDKKYDSALFFGLQPYLKMLEKGVSESDAQEFFEMWKEILGSDAPQDVVEKINSLVSLGYIPLEIKAVPEGTIVNNKNVLATVTNTVDGFHWVVGFFESLLLKVWAPTSVATLSNKFHKLAKELTIETSDSEFLLPFLIHDFGYRGVSSEESAQILGASHLVNSAGTDTVPAVKFVKENYGATGLLGASVPASEHSIHCSFGDDEEAELEYLNRMLDLNPTGLVSVVSDAYDYWRMLTVTVPKLKDKILARDGKLVIRPDSGDPKAILLGDLNAQAGSNEAKGTFTILEEIFGATTNSKGFKELNPKIGVIYGDGMFFDRFKDIVISMKERGLANTNLVVGIGGLLLQQHNRDDLGFAFKATQAIINGEAKELFKDPITDKGKRSHKGLMKLVRNEDGSFTTVDQVSEAEEKQGELQTVFLNGKVVRSFTFNEVRKNAGTFV